MLSWTVILLGALAGFTIFLGLPIAYLGAKATRVKGFLNATSVGILLFLAAEVLIKAWEPVEEAAASVKDAGASAWPAVGLGALFIGGIAVGLLSLVIFENRFIHHRARGVDAAADGRRLGLMIAIGIGLHNFSEGLAIGQSAASGALNFAVLLAVGFALHNATEGFGIAAPLNGTRPSLALLALAGLIGGGPTFIGAMVGGVYESVWLAVLFLALAAGALVYVIKELLHHGRKLGANADHLLVGVGLVAGLALGFGTDLIVGLAGA